MQAYSVLNFVQQACLVLEKLIGGKGDRESVIPFQYYPAGGLGYTDYLFKENRHPHPAFFMNHLLVVDQQSAYRRLAKEGFLAVPFTSVP